MLPTLDDHVEAHPLRLHFVLKIFDGLQDTVKLLGHKNLDVVDIFLSGSGMSCYLERALFSSHTPACANWRVRGQKIDCERCEWATYNDWLSDGVPLLHQVLVEVHEAPKNTALGFFDSLERAGYLTFHKEPNIQWGPSCIEYAFVRVAKPFVWGKKYVRPRGGR